MDLEGSLVIILIEEVRVLGLKEKVDFCSQRRDKIELLDSFRLFRSS